MTTSEKYAVWDKFLERWTIEALEKMTLEEYAMGGGTSRDSTDTFSYWLERTTKDLGSVFGSSAYKWQIFKRTSGKEYSSPQDEDWVWESRRFNTHEDIFAAVKRDIVNIAHAVRSGKIGILDDATVLWPIIRRKIAFLYQDRKNPLLIPVYKEEDLLRACPEQKGASISKLYAAVLAQHPGEDIFDIAEIVAPKPKKTKASEALPLEEYAALRDETVPATAVITPELNFTIWKMNHGKDLFKPKAVYQRYLDENVVVTGKEGELDDPKDGDVVYVCRSSTAISVIGLVYGPVFREKGPTGEDWYARKYLPLKRIDDVRYEVKKPSFGALPDTNNTLFDVKSDRLAEFEERLLKPYFGMTLEELRQKRKELMAQSEVFGGHSSETLTAVEEPAPEVEAPEATEAEEPLRSLLDLTGYPGMLATAYNLILSGAPGTGKTFMARQIADEMIASTREVFKARHRFVQFHLSYDYTDFVEGLRAYEANGQIGFRREDGIFKAFCKSALSVLQKNIGKAYRNCLAQLPETIPGDYGAPLELVEAAGMLKVDGDAIPVAAVEKFVRDGVETPEHPRLRELVAYLRKEHSHVIPPFVFIIDEINRGDLSKVFGELFFALDPGYRGPAGTIQTQYQNLVPEDDVFADGFYVPENVYIIGTMNDIDRNVESMDLAIRRRFTWSKVQPEETLGMLRGLEGCDYLGENPVAAATARLNAVNEAIMLPDLRLSEDYKVGPAYFLKLKVLSPRDGKTAWDLLWEKHLEPLLSEYLRNRREKDELLKKLKDAYDLKFAAESQY